ncbi:MAG: SMC-Scp complex subunit ScpB [bacterium]|nr:SMC-Scp complex subunit ScpB [bacterium]
MYDYKRILEALLFVSGDKPLRHKDLKNVLEITEAEFEKLIEEIKNEYSSRNSAITVKKISDGYLFTTAPDLYEFISKFFKNELAYKLSKSALEVLAIIAYNQPITRAEIEAKRGVDSLSAIETLLEKKLIKISGRKDAPGKPILYSTTDEFLKYLGISSLNELPDIKEFE